MSRCDVLKLMKTRPVEAMRPQGVSEEPHARKVQFRIVSIVTLV